MNLKIKIYFYFKKIKKFLPFEMDFKELYKGVPKYYYYVGKSENGDSIFLNGWKNKVWVRYNERPPKRMYDESKCWYCNGRCLSACSCDGVYRVFSAEEQEKRRKRFEK